MTLVFYISGHGFGHATRDIEVIDHIREQSANTRIVIRSAVPGEFLAKSARRSVDFEYCDADTGVAQIDSLRLNETETTKRAAAFYRDFHVKADAEAAVLRRLEAALVIGDVPPLAFAAAARAGVPSIALANFTWDWIYAAYPAFQELAPAVTSTIQNAYATASLALRLPFPGGFQPMLAVTRDVPLIARRSRRTRESTLDTLSLDDDRPIVLASFGGHGARLAFDEIAERNDLTIVLTDHEVRDGAMADGRLRRFPKEMLERCGIRYEDLVAAADVVVSKPGYGIVSECIANNAALLYTSRGPFAEEEVLVSGMQRFLRCRFIAQDDLTAGRWQPAIDDLRDQPAPSAHMDVNGAAVVAELILQALAAR